MAPAAGVQLVHGLLVVVPEPAPVAVVRQAEEGEEAAACLDTSSLQTIIRWVD